MSRPPLVRIGIVASILATNVAASRAENWPQWRGPDNNGISHETHIPTTWSKTENVAWRLPLPGPAGSTPIVWNKDIFLTSVDGDDLVLMRVSTDGKLVWKKKVSSGNKVVRGDEGNSASPSPSTDGKHVWVFFGTGDLACYDFDGNEVWKFNVQDRYGKFDIWHGMSMTPLLDGDRLYLALIHSGGSKVAAVDKQTGSEIWQQPRVTDAKSESEQSYASPLIYRDGKNEFLLTHGGDYIIAHRLNDGTELWRCGGMNSKVKYNGFLRFVASPAVGPGLIVAPTAKKGPVLGLSPDNMGDVSDSDAARRWKKTSGSPDVPSPLIHDGLVYLCDEGGFLSCLDASTGEEYYGKKRTEQNRHRASPVYADGKLYVTARNGKITVVKAGKEFEIVASNTLGEDTSSSPIISNGTMYIRTFDALYAIREQGKAE
jgi:outer membrane protein assembly factor BamB